MPKLIVVVAFGRDENGKLHPVYGPAEQAATAIAACETFSVLSGCPGEEALPDLVAFFLRVVAVIDEKTPAELHCRIEGKFLHAAPTRFRLK